MRRLARAGFRKVKAMENLRQHRIVRRQQDETGGPGAQFFAQGLAAPGIARAHDHQAAFGQRLGGGNGVAQPVLVRQQCKQTCVEAGGGSC